jgi:hypothetical protein
VQSSKLWKIKRYGGRKRHDQTFWEMNAGIGINKKAKIRNCCMLLGKRSYRHIHAWASIPPPAASTISPSTAHHRYNVYYPNGIVLIELDQENRVLRKIEMSPHHASHLPETSIS